MVVSSALLQQVFAPLPEERFESGRVERVDAVKLAAVGLDVGLDQAPGIP